MIARFFFSFFFSHLIFDGGGGEEKLIENQVEGFDSSLKGTKTKTLSELGRRSSIARSFYECIVYSQAR